MTTIQMTEGEMQQGLIEAAELSGWRVYHVANVHKQLRSRTAVGYPDLTMVHAKRSLVLFVELKNPKRQPTIPQLEWAQAIAQAASGITGVYHCLWRPEHYDAALEFLTAWGGYAPGITVLTEGESDDGEAQA